MGSVGEEVEGFDKGKVIRGWGIEEEGEVAGLGGRIAGEVDNRRWVDLGEAVN